VCVEEGFGLAELVGGMRGRERERERERECVCVRERRWGNGVGRGLKTTTTVPLFNSITRAPTIASLAQRYKAFPFLPLRLGSRILFFLGGQAGIGGGVGVEWRYGVGRAGWDGMDWLDLWKVVVGGGGGGGGGGRSEDGGLGKESGREHQPAPVSSISLPTFPP